MAYLIHCYISYQLSIAIYEIRAEVGVWGTLPKTVFHRSLYLTIATLNTPVGSPRGQGVALPTHKGCSLDCDSGALPQTPPIRHGRAGAGTLSPSSAGQLIAPFLSTHAPYPHSLSVAPVPLSGLTSILASSLSAGSQSSGSGCRADGMRRATVPNRAEGRLRKRKRSITFIFAIDFYLCEGIRDFCP